MYFIIHATDVIVLPLNRLCSERRWVDHNYKYYSGAFAVMNKSIDKNKADGQWFNHALITLYPAGLVYGTKKIIVAIVGHRGKHLSLAWQRGESSLDMPRW